MTADPAAAAAVGTGIPGSVTAPGLAAPGSAGPVGWASSQHDGGPPGGLVDPQVLYAATSQAAADPLVAGRLNEHLHDELRRVIGTVSGELEAATLAVLAGVQWSDSRDRTVAELAAAVLAQVATSPHLASEASAVRARVLAAPAATVGNVLGLDMPLIGNPALHADVTRGLAAEFGRLSGVSDQGARLVTQHSEALVNSSAATLDALVAQGSLTKQEEAALAAVLELAKLTDDNLALIRALLALGVTSPLALVAWTPTHWQQLITAQQVPVPPGETPSSYADTIMHNLETTYPAHALAAHADERHLTTLLERNPDLNLRAADLAGGAAANLDWTGIPAQDRDQVQRDLGSYQRLITLADSTEDRLALKRAGYDSALAIAAQPEEEFIRTSGLDAGRARLTYARAHNAAVSVAHHHAGLHHLLKTGFSNLPAGNTAPLADELREVEGMNELFGSQDFCDCDECHSVLSPAAYFVDLMHFVETNVSQPVFTGPGHADHPLHLRRRRPDLWTLQLSPANTSTLIPYLTIVNEVLESYLDQAGHGDIYTLLADPDLKVSFRVPFSLPFAELNLYLGHFGLAPADVYRTLARPEAQIRRARLGLAPDEAAVITSPDPSGVTARLGRPGGIAEFDLQDFLRSAGLQRDQLDALLASRFRSDLAAVTVTSGADPGELQNIPQVLSSLTPARLDFIHRFIRLWRVTPWQLAELDLILAAGHEAKLIGRDLDDRVIELLARLADLQGQLRLDPVELCALIDDLPGSATPHLAAPVQRHLYEQVFDVPRLFAPSPDAEGPEAGAPGRAAQQLAFPFHHYAFNTADPTDTSTDPKTPLLLAALGVSDTDLEVLLSLLADGLAFDAAGNCTMDRHRLSLLYRHARLAAALKLPIGDFGRVLQLLFDPAEQALTTLDQIEHVTAFVAWLRGTPFTIAELRFIVSGAHDASVSFTVTDGSTAQLVQQAQAAHAPDPRDALRSRLAVMLSLPLARLADLLAWIPADINGPGVKTALAASFAAGGTPVTPGDLIPLTDLGQQLERAALLFSKLKIDDGNLAYLTGHPAVLGITDPRSLTLADVRAMVLYSSMITVSSDAPAVIQAALGDTAPGAVPAAAGAVPAAAGAVQAPVDRRLADLWHVERILLSSLRKILPRARSPVDGLRHLRDAAALCTTLGANANSLAGLGKDGSFHDLSQARDIALGAVSAKYSDAAEREHILQPVQDRINVLQRDALCDYIMGRQAELGFRTHADIYDFFLLDVDMGDCFRTSRVVSASSTLQQYVQRCMQNLERTRGGAHPHVPAIHVQPGRIPAGEWEWRKNFRVWQANRKVFLYPESYIDPDLLDIKTPLFDDLEDDLLQQKITMESATDAYQRYLTRFAELAHLRIAGSCYYADTHHPKYYFFGHTHEDPPAYYWRCWDEATWSPWQKIDIAIDAHTVSAEFHLGRLYLFWVDAKCKDKTAIKDGNSQLQYYEVTISLQYSVLRSDGKWLPPQKLDSLRPLRTAAGAWNNRLYPDPKAVASEVARLAQAGIDVTPFHAAQQEGNKTDSAHGILAESTEMTEFLLTQMEGAKIYQRVYPGVAGDSVVLRYINGYLRAPDITDRELDLFHNKLRASGHAVPHLPARPAVLLYPEKGGKARLGIATAVYHSEPEFDLALEQLPLNIVKPPPLARPHIYLTGPFAHHPPAPDEERADHVLDLVHNRHPESILTFEGQQYLIHGTPAAAPAAHHAVPAHHAAPAHHPAAHPAHHSSPSAGHGSPGSHGQHPSHDGTHPASAHPAAARSHRGQAARATSIAHVAQAHAQSAGRRLVRLSTSNADDLGEILLRDGLDELFALETQQRREKPVGFTILSPAELKYPDDDPHHLNFRGAMGDYYRELYLHIPWLIARALRADGKYEDTLWWYRKIFDPTAEADPHRDAKPADRNWRYIEFRDLTLPRLQAMLTDPAAIAAYEQDPFNPHAIARLRPSAYQRAIVMDTIGTLRDMGDALFTQDTMESVTEAGMVYNLAAQMLGPRPARLGRCRTVPDAALTYGEIGPTVAKGSELLLMLENWTYANHAANVSLALRPYHAVADERRQATALQTAVKHGTVPVPARHAPATPTVLPSTLAFCIPPNDVLLDLYDQVEDRLFKIRNCMNISGVRRELALFAPPIDVMALVRARAAGLSLDEVMAALEAPVPPYRFTHLIDKARQAAQTVQSFGGALLSALEKKDTEELTLLRSLHERDVLRMTKNVKTDQVKEAQHQLQALAETETNVQNRIDYYSGLIDAGHTAWEVTEQVSRVTATVSRGFETYFHLGAAIAHLFPDVGSPFAMKYGGTQLGDAQSAFGAFTASLAGVLDGVAASAGLQATFERREQEWHHELLLAQQESKQVEQQRLAAEIRAAITEKELDIHQTTMDQADELDHFYKNKFTSLGLYNYLATTLTRLHRDAYNTAEGLARMAQRAYAFERDDDTVFIAPGNWQADKNGLLAGEKLTLQLEQLETAYLRANTRQLEVSQSFSVALLDPGALLTFRETGSCEFTVPEILFDLAYPGQYKRIIKSARISIPCVVGPYTTVSAKLTLTGSKVRKQATTNPDDLISLPAPPTPSIATSTAVNDAGMFELTFRDERYLPFEGAGAISSWRLELPDQLRMFDYATIPDIILHISYTARDDDAFRVTVETAITDSLTAYASTAGMHRLFSLRHDFPDAFYQFLNPVGAAAQQTRVKLGREHFPFFLSTRTLNMTGTSLFIQPEGAGPVDTTDLTISVNNNPNAAWTTPPKTNLRAAEIPASGPALTDWTIKITAGKLNPVAVNDVLLLFKYGVS
jgi:hypothetical protein